MVRNSMNRLCVTVSFPCCSRASKTFSAFQMCTWAWTRYRHPQNGPHVGRYNFALSLVKYNFANKLEIWRLEMSRNSTLGILILFRTFDAFSSEINSKCFVFSNVQVCPVRINEVAQQQIALSWVEMAGKLAKLWTSCILVQNCFPRTDHVEFVGVESRVLSPDELARTEPFSLWELWKSCFEFRWTWFYRNRTSWVWAVSIVVAATLGNIKLNEGILDCLRVMSFKNKYKVCYWDRKGTSKPSNLMNGIN